MRATLDAAGGEYDPDRVIKLRQLVDAHPEDPTYRFLLAGLYKNGRYFEEAFDEYKRAIELDQGLEQAHINIGNIFYMTGQYGEAVANYRRASDVNPRAILAHFNAHLAQSEAFRFQEAEESLRRAREIDPKRVTDLLSSASGSETRANVEDATIETASIWDAAIRGRRPRAASEAGDEPPGMFAQLLNPVSGVALLALLACLILQAIGRGHDAARCCIRCGRPFCHYCKSNREGHEYCSQCLHLYVLGDGLAPGAKNHKLYEVSRHEQRARRTRRLSSLVLPGSGHFLRDRTWFGAILLFLWLAAMVAWQPSLMVPLEGGLGVDLRLDQLRAAAVPATRAVDPLALLAALMLPGIWLAGNFWRWKRREV